MFSIYCDDYDSQWQDKHRTFCHTAFVCDDSLLSKISNNVIKYLKKKYNLSRPLHCRELFHPDARRKHRINIDDNIVFEIYGEIVRFLAQFPHGKGCMLWINWSDYSLDDWSKIKSIKSLEYQDGTQEALLINEETIMLYLEHAHACIHQSFNGKFYRETGTDKKKIAQNFNNQNNRRIIQNFLNHEISFIDAKDAPHPELYEIADFLAYLSGFCLHESQKKVFRQLNKDQLFKGRKFFEWYDQIPKKAYNVKLFGIGVENMVIDNGVLKYTFT